MIETIIVRDFAALQAIAPAWWSLWARCPHRMPFQSPAWLLTWWRAFEPGELMVFTFRGADRLLGIAPFYIERGAYGTRLLPIGISLSDFVDILVEPGCEFPVINRLAIALAAEPVWDAIEINDLPPDAVALRLGHLPGCTMTEQSADVCPVLTLDATMPVDVQLPARQRRKLRMANHRARRRGTLEYVLADAAAAPRAFDWLVRLHTERWQGRQQPGVLADPSVKDFHADIVRALMPLGIIRLYALRIAGETAAVYYGFQDAGRAYAYIGGFDPRFAFESPGALLLAHVIVESSLAGAREFHFLRGAESYKYAWGAVDRTNRRRNYVRAAAGDR